MPKELERKLKRRGKMKGFKGKRLNAFVYGIMRKTGWKPSTRKKKGRKKIKKTKRQ